MANFVFPGLLGPLFATVIAAVSLPILIHLINMLRHRRVQWAAMEFLLASFKRHRTWVRLKQLILLLMRIAALVIVVLMLAQPKLSNQFGSWLGSGSTHHIVLLDDSYSMSDHWADTSAFSEATKAVQRLGQQVAAEKEIHTFTLMRFSQVDRPGREAQVDMQQVSVNRDTFADDLEMVLGRMRASQSAVGPRRALESVQQLLDESSSQRQIVYLFSDFRNRDWKDPTDLKKLLGELNGRGVEVVFVSCVREARPNLTIAALAPAEGIRAAGVPFEMEVEVTNYGKSDVRNVNVAIEEDEHAGPSVRIPEIKSGKRGKTRFQVNFVDPGSHLVKARLESDAVAVDNLRYAELDIPRELPLLIVDGDPEAREARFIARPLSPGGAVRTGLRPQTEGPRYLALKSIAEFQSVTLVNVEHLDPSAIESLERYVSGGGGVAFFVGERTAAKFVNDALYKDGAGLFPLPVKAQADLPVDRLDPTPDVEIPQPAHFVTRVFEDPDNAFVGPLRVRRYLAAADGWRPPAGSTVEVIARLRNGAPLAVTKTFGKGRVVVFLTTAGLGWNNWARNPSFPVMMLDLHAFLARRENGGAGRQVGAPLAVRLEGPYKHEVAFSSPQSKGQFDVKVDASVGPDRALWANFLDTDEAGIYTAQLTRTDDTVERRNFAVNVDPAEGDLEIAAKTDLAARLAGIDYVYQYAQDLQFSASELAGYNLSQALMYFLILLLLGEQVMAWSASYHMPAHAAKGGAR